MPLSLIASCNSEGRIFYPFQYMRTSIHSHSIALLMCIVMVFASVWCSSKSSSYESHFDSAESAVSHGTDMSLLKSLPIEIFVRILSFTDRLDIIAIGSTCSLFADCGSPHLSSSFGFLFYNWIGESRDQLKLCVCPGNEESYINEFVLASRSIFVCETHFSSFKYFILALHFGFMARSNQKILISSSNVTSLDLELNLTSFFQNEFSEALNSGKFKIDTISVNSSDENDLLWLTSFLALCQGKNVSLSKLELNINTMPSKVFEEFLLLISSFNMTSLLVDFHSYDFLGDKILQLIESYAPHIVEMRLAYFE